MSALIFVVFGSMLFSLVHAQATATAADTTSAQNSTRTTVGAIAPPTPYFSESDTEYWITRLSSEASILSSHYGPYTTSTMFWPDWTQRWGSWISAASSDGPNNETTIWDVYTAPRGSFCTPEVRGSQYPSSVWDLVKSRCTPTYAVTSGPVMLCLSTRRVRQLDGVDRNPSNPSTMIGISTMDPRSFHDHESMSR